MSAQPTCVSVRMYRALDPDKPYKGLLGDCFLIRLGAGTQRSNILIDFGLLLGSPDAEQRAGLIAEDIVRTCGGSPGKPGRLDLLVVTHEHWDHISGFSQARGIIFDDTKLVVDNLWMAWTEDLDDPLVEQLHEKFDKSGSAFAALAERLQQNSIVGLDPSRATRGLEAFLGATEKNGKLAGRDILAKLKTKNQNLAGTGIYREPGEARTTPGDVGLHVYVLGPPRDLKKLFKDTPSSGAAQETYLTTPTLGDALLRVAADGADPLDLADSPFAPQFQRCPLKELEKAGQAAPRSTTEPDAAWVDDRYFLSQAVGVRKDIADRRRIDGEWLAAAGALALKLDSDTNNTSLALAFDLPDGTAMLFAADAQVGNWLSWHDYEFKTADGHPQRASDILQRTRFYKVGHHGSHNATLDKLGLALMTRDDLVAAIPTDEELGMKQGKGGWQMPNPRVRAALLDRTKGRILRNDRRYHLDDPAARAKDADLQNVEPTFFEQLTETDLYLEFQIVGSKEDCR